MRTLVASAILFMFAAFAVPASARAPASPAPTPAASDELQRSQAAWYRAQAIDLATRNRFLEALPALAAGVGAWIALMQLFFNAASGAQQQRDAQLNEALKRLGDKNPSLRATAAGMLGVLAQDNRARSDFIVEQLIIGLGLETNDDVMDAIERAIAACRRPASAAVALAPWRWFAEQRIRSAREQALARARSRFYFLWKIKLSDALTGHYRAVQWPAVSEAVDAWTMPDDAWAKLGITQPWTTLRAVRLETLSAADRRAFHDLTTAARLWKQRYDHLMNVTPNVDRYVQPPAW